MADQPIRIAMWSGPRTVSTALMRAWENRPDTVVADEPLYAFYLDRTGLAHPGREQVIASQPTSWQAVIRDPRELLASYARVRATPSLDDLGVWQQAEIFDRFGGPVVDARDLLEHPEAVLRALCAALDVPFTTAMLSWPAGRRETDGVWAPHWYDSVWRSTGFGPYHPRDQALPPPLAALADQCQPFYQRLRACRLTG